MKTKIKILTILICFMLGFFILPKIAISADQDVIITEIGAYEKSEYEWLEIHNKGSEPADLTGWKFYENDTNHKLNPFQGDMIIEPGEYAIIANVGEKFQEKYPDFTGTIIDSSWSSLKESGEEIGLKNAGGEIIELFTYIPCSKTSLQRIDLNSNDYTEANWQPHPTSNSAGRENEFSSQDNNEPVDDENNPNEQDNEEDGKEDDIDQNEEAEDSNPPKPNFQQIVSSGSIVINEFVSDPADGEEEWIELYNKNSFDVDLTGWIIIDGAETATKLSGLIGSNYENRFLVIEKPKGKLNNPGDAIILKNNNNDIIDAVYYGNWDKHGLTENNAPVAKRPFSTARIFDGANTFNNKKDFVVTQTPTKGEPNLITLLESEQKQETSNAAKNETPVKIDYKEVVRINEIYPNPPGSDLENEWLELKNIGQREIDLAGFKIQDNSKMTYKISAQDFATTVIGPNGFFIIERKTSGLAFNNDKETIKLIAPDDKTIQTVKYSESDNVPEDVSFAIDEEGEWFFTTTPTKNKDNIITKLNHEPIIEIYCPKQAFIGEKITCDASDSYDLENDLLNFTWKIGEQLFHDVILQTYFMEKGTYLINLFVGDGQAQSKESYKIKIIEPEKEASDAVTETKIKKNEDGSIAITLQDIRLLEKNTKVVTRGVVSVLPNTFGKTIMYLAGSGIQLYMSKADWPDLKIGDLIEVSGTLTESLGENRIKLSAKTDIVFIESLLPPMPKPIKIADIGESTEGWLIQIQGRLIEKSGSKFYLQDETGEALVYIKQNAKISKTDFTEGDELIISGIVSQNNDIYQVLPRSMEDLVKNHEINHEESLSLPQNKTTSSVLKYLITGGIFLAMGLLSVFYNSKTKKQKINN